MEQLRTFWCIQIVSTTFLGQDTKIHPKTVGVCPKLGFWRISLFLSTLEHMLLHKSYINVAIANILLCRKSLYDLSSPKYKIRLGANCVKRAWPETTWYHRLQKWYQGQMFSASSKDPITVEKTLLTRKANGWTFRP